MEASVPILPSLQLKLFFGLVRTENLNCPYLLPKSIWFPGRKISKVNWKYLMNLNIISVVSCSIYIYTPQISTFFQHPQYWFIIFQDVTSWFNLNNSFSLIHPSWNILFWISLLKKDHLFFDWKELYLCPIWWNADGNLILWNIDFSSFNQIGPFRTKLAQELEIPGGQ